MKTLILALMLTSARGRAIKIDVVVDAKPSEVYAMWTTSDGIKKFLAPAASIDARVGGDYNVIFYPALDPDGSSYGTRGARVLDLAPDRSISFEWQTFIDHAIEGAGGPPADAAARRERPLPTWVEIDLEPVGANQTRIRFAHYGFRAGGKWDESYEFFDKAWRGVLASLGKAVVPH
jgi:uncharacterized protein YndB with AHSA1/START domain